MAKRQQPMLEEAPPFFLTLDQAAKRLTIGKTKLYELIARGAIPVVHIDRVARIRPGDLEQFVARLEEKAR
jgi:excisionase family DNA binding protein